MGGFEPASAGMDPDCRGDWTYGRCVKYGDAIKIKTGSYWRNTRGVNGPFHENFNRPWRAQRHYTFFSDLMTYRVLNLPRR